MESMIHYKITLNYFLKTIWIEKLFIIIKPPSIEKYFILKFDCIEKLLVLKN